MQHPISLRPYRPLHLPGLVRVGRDFDGGYVLPREVIERSHGLLSLGVNDDWSFEEGVLARNPAVRVTCVDGTTGLGRVLIKAFQKVPDMIGHALSLQFGKALRDARYWSKPFAFKRFFSRHELLSLMVAVQPSPGSITLSELLERMSASCPDGWIIVKSDIEGAEFEVLPESIGRMERVSALLIEFHRLELHWDRFVDCMQELGQRFHIAHLHGNNFDDYIPGSQVPSTLEMTLVNKAFMPGPFSPAGVEYPLAGLDMPNTRKRPDLRIGFT